MGGYLVASNVRVNMYAPQLNSQSLPFCHLGQQMIAHGHDICQSISQHGHIKVHQDVITKHSSKEACLQLSASVPLLCSHVSCCVCLARLLCCIMLCLAKLAM